MIYLSCAGVLCPFSHIGCSTRCPVIHCSTSAISTRVCTLVRGYWIGSGSTEYSSTTSRTSSTLAALLKSQFNYLNVNLLSVTAINLFIIFVFYSNCCTGIEMKVGWNILNCSIIDIVDKVVVSYNTD